MTYKREVIIKLISDNLAFSDKSTAFKNIIGLFDSNRTAQDFFSQLFSLVFWYSELKNLDKLNDICNYPAIDLGDKSKRVAFQITTDKTSWKVADTIIKFNNHHLYKEYDRLIFFIIWEKQGSYIDFDTEGKFSFDKINDIWDSNFLIKQIDKIEDIKDLENIQKFLEDNLLEFKFPERLYESDIKKCIEILKRDFWSVPSIEDSFKRKDDEFILRKNQVNNVSWDFFQDKIRWHLMYNSLIVDFLNDEINKEARNDYLEVAKAIQDFYKNTIPKFSSFEDVFREIFQKINCYEDNIAGIDIKLKILLHTMYFNCDIGTNPDLDA